MPLYMTHRIWQCRS